jgi:hypothetical protein
MDRFSHQNASVLDHRRWQIRYDCKLPSRISTAGHDAACTITNIAAGGLGIKTDAVLRLQPNSRVIVSNIELGTMNCNVRWSAGTNSGLQFLPTNSTPPKVREYLSRLAADAGN